MSRFTLLGLLLLPLAAWSASAVKPAVPAKATPTSVTKPAAAPVVPTETEFPLGPMPPGAKVGWTHAPYQDGDCSLCHERKDPKSPGKLFAPVNEVCLSCHEEFSAVLGRGHVHRPTKKSCSNCHNAHNSPEKKLLHADVPKLCAGCHDETLKEIGGAKVKHAAVERDRKCLNCHNPHSSSFEQLLVKAPFDLCVSCHDEDGMKDGDGKVLTNIGKLLKDNPTHHKPVAEKDCSACHSPHASPNFRLLSDPYPAEFYSDYDANKYKLCFGCHKPDAFNSKETMTLTKFRDGPKNLHYAHVNVVEGRGRTCRACHEVHASKQPHIIRDSVPFGPRGWLLKTNFHALPNGGSCDKTCHAAKTYVNKTPGQKDPAPPKDTKQKAEVDTKSEAKVAASAAEKKK